MRGLDNLAYAGLCLFVVTLSGGGDGRTAGGLALSTWFALIPLGFVTLRILTARRLRRPTSIHSLLLAFTAWVAASSIWTLARDSTLTRLGTYIALLIFVALIWELGVTTTRIQGLIVSYVLGAGIASAMTIYNYLTGQSTSQLEGQEWDTLRYSVEGVNADELGLIVGLSIPMALYLLITSKNRVIRMGCWIHLAAGFIAMFLSGTRGAMIALLAGTVLICGPILSRMSNMQRTIAVFMLPAVVCAAL